MDHITIGIGNEKHCTNKACQKTWVSSWTSSSKKLHTSTLSSSLCYQFKNIQNITGKLDFEAVITVVQTLKLTKLNYCNSLLVGTPDYCLSHLQHIQNMACRVVCNLRKYDHVMASIKTLHLLRVREHISYKTASQVH